MNAVQKIKARHEAREWADIEGIWRSIKPAMEANVQRRREEEAQRMKRHCRYQVSKVRKGKVNAALQRAGIPLRVL